uniref:RNA polymerase Rpb4/RPC9 core domain-containing protein n=1 Tax=Ananas comosus var. bracteatus TaxID=296719 RepID=A0A6V7QQW7_ANACO
MADRGGKGWSAGKGKAPSVPNQGALNGEDPASFKRPVHVDIDSSDESEGFIEDQSQASGKSNGKAPKKVPLDSLKTGGKASNLASAGKGDSGKGGKSFNAGKVGGKGSLPHAKPPTAEVDLKLELVLMDCEAAEVLQDIHDHMTILSEDPTIKIPESFNKAFQYSKNGSQYTDAKSVRQICMIGNVCPETVEEAYGLVPSLKANRQTNEGPIREALTTLVKLKSSK